MSSNDKAYVAGEVQDGAQPHPHKHHTTNHHSRASHDVADDKEQRQNDWKAAHTDEEHKRVGKEHHSDSAHPVPGEAHTHHQH